MKLTPKREHSPCHCVLRAVFRMCWKRYLHCEHGHGFVSASRQVMFKTFSKHNRPNAISGYAIGGYAMKRQEYCVDFCLIAKRTLSPEQWRVFSLHYLSGQPYTLCTQRLGLNRGEFWHEVYRIQQDLGRAFAETQPYALFPLDEYFGGTVRPERTRPNVIQFPKRLAGDLFPLRRAA